MKSARHEAVLNIVKNEKIETQEVLTARLRELGFAVTQATVSRDIRQLGLVKVHSADGHSHYAAETARKSFAGRLNSILRESVNHVDSAENIVVVKTLAGVANAAAAAIDSMQNPAIVGTLAGDDTILIVLRDRAAALSIREEIEKQL